MQQKGTCKIKGKICRIYFSFFFGFTMLLDKIIKPKYVTYFGTFSLLG